MPVWLQYIAQLSPVTHYMSVLSGIFLKGVGIDVLWPQALSMAGLGIGLLALSMWRLNKVRV